MAEFFKGQEAKVRVGQTLSSTLTTHQGVPQGSVLSATLFLVFMDSLLKSPLQDQVVAFADDVALMYSHEDINFLQMRILNGIFLRSWCISNNMEVNVNKTKYVNFDFRRFDFPNALVYHSLQWDLINCRGCKVIEKRDSFKYLGMVLHEKLIFEKHITVLHKQISCSIRKFYYLRNFWTDALLKTLYFALIHSRLQYCVVCLGGT